MVVCWLGHFVGIAWHQGIDHVRKIAFTRRPHAQQKHFPPPERVKFRQFAETHGVVANAVKMQGRQIFLEGSVRKGVRPAFVSGNQQSRLGVEIVQQGFGFERAVLVVQQGAKRG